MALMMNEILHCPNCKSNQFEKKELVCIEVDRLTKHKKVIQTKTGYFCSNCSYKIADLRDVTN